MKFKCSDENCEFQASGNSTSFKFQIQQHIFDVHTQFGITHLLSNIKAMKYLLYINISKRPAMPCSMTMMFILFLTSNRNIRELVTPFK